MVKKAAKIFFISVVFLIGGVLFAKSVSAATYYISVVDGSDTGCTGLASTTYPGSGTGVACPWKTVNKVNSSSFLAGDQILFKKGETWNESLFVPSSGSLGNPIVFGAYGSGNKPIFTDNTSDYNVRIYQKNYVTVQNFDLRETNASYSRNVRLDGNTGVVLQNLDMSSSGSNIGAVTTQTNLNILNVVSNSLHSSGNVVYIQGSGNSGVIIDGVTASGGNRGIWVTNTTGLTLNNVTYSNAGLYAINILSSSNLSLSSINITNSVNTGIFFDTDSGSFSSTGIQDTGSATALNFTSSNFTSGTLTNATLTNNTTQGIYFSNSSGITFDTGTISGSGSDGGQLTGTTHDVVFNDFTFSNNGGNGFSANNDTYNVTFTRGTFNNNHSNGFGAYGNVHGITFISSVMHDNGDKSILADGCAVAVHSTSYDINIENSLSYNNIEGGFCAINTSAGTIENSVAYNNGGAWSSSGGLDSARGGIFISTSGPNPTNGKNWIIKNIISALNYPREVRIDSPANEQVVINYNNYYPANNNNFASLDAGITNISWSAYSSREPNSVNSNPLFINAPVNFQLQQPSPAIDMGTNVGLAADYLGNSIYGAPDVGAYEYQPPHTMGTNKIDVGAGARIYGDGKFRDLGITNSILADLKITPTTGIFSENTSPIPAWLDVSNVTWSNTGNHHKAWRESNAEAALNNTVHTVGDLEVGKYYNVSVDGGISNLSGCRTIGTNFVCQANGDGKISFTWEGGYSTHDFNITEGDNTAPIRSSGLPFGSQSSGAIQTTLSLTTDESSTCKYSATAGIAYNLMANIFTSTGNMTHSATVPISNGQSYSYYIRCQDLVGNINTDDYIISFSVSLPIGGNGPPSAALYNNFSSPPVPKSGDVMPENSQQINKLSFIGPLTKYLQYKQTSDDIKHLQVFLNSDPDTQLASSGIGSPGKETNYFGILTYKAVIKFQEKYAKDILMPWGFTKGTGYVGKTTLIKINTLTGNK